MIFEEFEKQLWEVIHSTTHSKNHSDEQRYIAVKKALLGDYKADPKPPKGFTLFEMMNLFEEATSAQNIEGTIKSFLKERQTPIIEEDPDRKAELEYDQAEQFDADLKAIKQYFHRHKDIHQWELFRRKQ